METVILYREIGKMLHNMGANRVVLVKSKVIIGEVHEMYLEIAVDGTIDIKKALVQCSLKWTQIKMNLLDLNSFENLELMQEVIEDGIQL